MTPFKHILVPTDFCEPADRALDLAIALASKFESKVTLLHASWSPPLAYTGYQGMAWPIDDLMKGAEKELEGALARAKARYPNIDGLITTSEPAQTILQVAKQRGADLIVMGTRGRHGLSRVLLGSVAEKVVRLSPIPVLTVSGRAEQETKEKVLEEAWARNP